VSDGNIGHQAPQSISTNCPNGGAAPESTEIFDSETSSIFP